MSWHIYPAAAAAAVRRSVRPCRHGTKRVLSLVTYLLHVGGTQVAHPTGGGPWTYSLPNEHIHKKRKKEIWVSLFRRAQIPHSTRTNLRYMVLLHSTHTTNLHYTTCLYLLLLLRRQRSRMFQIKDVLFSLQCRALTRDIRYTLPPSCLLARRKDDAKLASSILHTLPY